MCFPGQEADDRKRIEPLVMTPTRPMAVPMVRNPDGSVSTQELMTVTDPRINGGAPTNIPSIWDGKRAGDEGAVMAALRSGFSFPRYKTIDAAIRSAIEESEQVGNEIDYFMSEGR